MTRKIIMPFPTVTNISTVDIDAPQLDRRTIKAGQTIQVSPEEARLFSEATGIWKVTGV